MKRIFTLAAFIFLFSYLAQAQPTTQATSIFISPFSGTSTSIRFDWTNGNGTNRIVILKTVASAYSPTNLSASPTSLASSLVSAFPANGSGNDLDGPGSEIAACIFNSAADGGGTTVRVTGLTAGTAYTVQVYEYTGTGTSTKYLYSTTTSNAISFQLFTSAGSNTWTAPTVYGVNKAYVQAWGAGGGGGNSNNAGSNGGGGGGGGSYSAGSVTVAAGTTYNVIVGQGGRGGLANTTTSGNNGKYSWFSATDSTSAMIRAVGGSVGVNGGNGGAGAPTTNALGTVKIAGGTGGNSGSTGGAGGGSSAGSGSNGAGAAAVAGTNGSGGAAGTGVIGGGDGGAGSTTTDGSVGLTPGGGGGGGNDAAANKGGAGADGLVIVSYNVPTCYIVTQTPTSPTNQTTVTFRVTFSENMSNVSADGSDFVLSGTASTGATISTVNTITGTSVFDVVVTGISGTANGTVTLGFAGGQDIAASSGNVFKGTITSNQSYTIDTTAPMASAPASTAQRLKDGATSTSTVESTEDGLLYLVLTGEAAGTTAQLATAVAAFKAFSISATANTARTVPIPTPGSPLVDGVYDIVAVDNAGNVSSIVAGWLTIDNTLPTVTIDQGGSQTDPTSTLPVTFDIVFSEVIDQSTLVTGDITTGGTATGQTVAGLVDTGDHQHFTLTINATGQGTISPSITAGKYADVAGNVNTAASTAVSDGTVTYNTAPSVVVSQAGAQADPTNGNTVNFTAVFSAAVTALGTNYNITGTSTGATKGSASSSDGGITWTIPLNTTAATDGTLSVTISAGAVQSQSGSVNNLASTNGPDNQVTLDKTKPVISSVTSNATGAGVVGIGGTIIFTVTLGAVESPAATILPTTYNGGTLTWGTADGQTYTATYTAATSGQADQTTALQLTGVTATDAAGNISTSANGTDVVKTIDVTPPPTGTVTVASTGGTVVPAYYNLSNTGIDITIPQAAMNDNSLTGGTYTIKINDSNTTVGAIDLVAATGIVLGDINAAKVISVNHATLSANAKYANPSTLYFFVVLADNAGNSTTGNLSSSLTVDRTAPGSGTVGAVAATGNRTVAAYYNSTNTGLNVTVPMSNSDGSLDNGKIQVRVQNTGNAGYVDIGGTGNYTIQNSDRVAGTVTISISSADLEAATSGALGFAEGAKSGLASSETSLMQITAIVTDVAGNPGTQYIKSSTNIDVDQTPPTSATAFKVAPGAGSGGRDAIEFVPSEIMCDFAGTPAERVANFAFVSASTAYGSSGLSVGAGTTTGNLASAKYVYQGATNTIESTFINVHLLYLESNANSDTWDVSSGTKVQYVQFGSASSNVGMLKDAAGNEMTAFNTLVSAGTATTLGTASNGVVGSPLIAGNSGKVVFAFSLTGSSSLNMTALSIHTSNNTANQLTNFHLWSNTTSDSYPTGATDLGSCSTTSSSVDFNTTVGLTTSTTYFYLVCDVSPYFLSASPPTITFSLPSNALPNVNGGFTVSAGGYAGSTQTGTTYSFSDQTAPSISSITLSKPTSFTTTSSPQTQIVAVKYNEPMDGATAPVIGLSAGTWSASAGAWSTQTLTNDTYTVTFTYTGSNQYNASVTASVSAAAKDLGGNSTSGTSAAFLLDTQLPTAVVAVSPTTITTNATVATVTITFSEAMTPGAVPGTPVTFSAGTWTAGSGVWSGGNTIYTIPYTWAGGSQTLTGVTASANGYTDANTNVQTVAGTSTGFNVDTQRPFVSSITRGGAGQYTKGPTVTYLVTFNEAVSNVQASNFTPVVNSGTVSAGSISGSPTTTDNINWTVTVTGLTGGDGDVQLNQTSSGTIVDANSNAINTTHNGDEIYSIDNTPPYVKAIKPISVNGYAASVNGVTNTSPLGYIVHFSEAVNGLNAGFSDFNGYKQPNTSSNININPVNIVSVNGTPYDSLWQLNASYGSGVGTFEVDYSPASNSSSVNYINGLSGIDFLVDPPFPPGSGNYYAYDHTSFVNSYGVSASDFQNLSPGCEIYVMGGQYLGTVTSLDTSPNPTPRWFYFTPNNNYFTSFSNQPYTYTLPSTPISSVTGSLSSTLGSNNVTGIGTLFTAEVLKNDLIFDATGSNFIGVVSNINSSTTISLKHPARFTNSGGFSIRRPPQTLATSAIVDQAGNTITQTNFAGTYANICNPAPTAAVTGFTATPANKSITVNWTDEASADHYLVMLRNKNSIVTQAGPTTPVGVFPTPANGTFLADDIDFTDGLLMSNINQGVKTATFSGLNSGADYEVWIYSYSLDDNNIVAGNRSAVAYFGTPAKITSTVTTISSTTSVSIVSSASSIPSTVTASTGQTVLSFKINEDALATVATDDNSPFKFNTLVIIPGATNALDWAANIAGAELTNSGNGVTKTAVPTGGSPATSKITFTGLSSAVGGEGYIADGSNKTYTLNIYLKTAVTDNTKLDFKVDATSFTLYDNSTNSQASSQLQPSGVGSSVSSGSVNITVTATALRFTTQPVLNPGTSSQQYVLTNFTTQPVVKAMDANGNVDVDYTGATYKATISTTVGGPTFNTANITPSLGVYDFSLLGTPFKYNDAGSSTNAGALTLTTPTGFPLASINSTSGSGFVACSTVNVVYFNGTVLSPGLLTGTITSSTGSSTVTGTGTLFTTELLVGSIITNAAGTPVGTVLSITSNTSLTLSANAALTIAGGNGYKSGVPTISSVASSNVPVFYFTVTDDGGAGGDGEATKITGFTFTPTGGQNQFANFQDLIASATLSDNSGFTQTVTQTLSTFGQVNSANITFTNVPIATLGNVADNANKVYTLSIIPKTALTGGLQSTADNLRLAFDISKANITLNTNGSTIPNGQLATSDNTTHTNDKFDVQATKIILNNTLNATQSYDAALSPTLTGEATDAYGTRDLNYNTAVSFTALGNPVVGGITFPIDTNPNGGTLVTASNGLLTFDATDMVKSSGGGTNNSIVDFTVSSGALISATVTGITFGYSGASDIIQNSSGSTTPVISAFTHSKNILYANYQGTSFSSTTTPATTGVAIEEFLVRDGGGASDADGTATTLQTITLTLSNYNYLRQVALYAGTTMIAEASIASVTNVSGNTADLTFSGFTNSFSVPDNQNKALTVYATFIGAGMVDNTIVQVKVKSVAAGAVSSSFVPGTFTAYASLAAKENQIEVVANHIDFTTPSTYPDTESVYTSFTVVAQAKDVNLNLDTDYNGAVSFTGNANTSGYTVANLPTGNFSGGILNYPTNTLVLPSDNGFQFTSGTSTTQLTINGGAANTGGVSVDAGAITGTSGNIIVQTSFDSWVYFDNTFSTTGYTPQIDFANHQETSLTTSSQPLALLVLSDGGAPGSLSNPSTNPNPGSKTQTAHNDSDGAFTQISSLSLSVNKVNLIRTIAIFDNAGTKIDEQTGPLTSPVTFNNLDTYPNLVAPDNGVTKFYIRASFVQTVTDQDQLQLQIANVTYKAGSNFPAATVGGIAGGDVFPSTLGVAGGPNYLNVIATTLDFTVPPSSNAGVGEPIGTVPSNVVGFSGGVGYTDGTYYGVQLVKSSGTAVTAPIVDITVVGGVLSLPNITKVTNGQDFGTSTFSCPASAIGGTGSGWSITVTSVPWSYGSSAALTLMPYTYAAVVTARDVFTNIDTGFNPSTTSVTDSYGNGVNAPTAGFSFKHGVLDLNGMSYKAATVTAGGNGTLSVSANGVNSPTSGLYVCSTVKVSDVAVSYNPSGLVQTPDNTGQANLKGGKTNLTIFGLTFTPSGVNGSEPKLNKFIIGFKTGFHSPNSNQWYQNTNTATTVFSNFKVNFKSYDVASNGGSVTPFASTNSGEYDWLLVDVTNFSASSGTVTNSLASGPADVQLTVDISSTTSGATQTLVPYLVDDGYNTVRVAANPESSINYANVLLSSGTGQSTGYNTGLGNNTGQTKVAGGTNEIDGIEYNFASANPPKLLADINVYPTTYTNPYTPKSNVDPVNLAGPVGKPQVILAFDTKVGVLDDPTDPLSPTGSIYRRLDNSKVADLYFDLSGSQVQALVSSNGQTIKNAATYDRLVFNVCNVGQPGTALSTPLNYDDVYYVKVVQGSYDQNKQKGTGIADLQLNFFGGVNDNFTLYFKTWTNTAPMVYDVKSPFSTISYGTISATFDQLGTAYFLVVPNGTTAPTATQIKNASVAHVNTVTSTSITQLGAQGSGPSQYFGFPIDPTMASLSAGAHDYDVYIYTENNAGSPVGSSVYQYVNLITASAESDPAALTNPKPNLSTPIYKVCPDSYSTLTQPIVLMENSGTGKGYFNLAGDQTVNILLPTGYEFDTKVTPQVVIDTVAANDFINLVSVPANNPQHSKKVATSYSSNSILKINFNNSGSANYDVISISGLRVIGRRDALTGALPSSGNITWFYGNDAITINHTSQVPLTLATISPNVPSNVPDFYNYYWYHTDSVSNYHTRYTGNSAYTKAADYFHKKKKVNAIPLNFTSALAPTGQVRLTPDPTTFTIKEDYLASTFSGSGVSGDLLTLSAVTKDAPFNITMSHTDVNGCAFTQSNQYIVYDPNSPISKNLGVPGHTIAGTVTPFTAGTVQDIANTNFNSTTGASNLTLKVGEADSLTVTPVTQIDKAGYTLLELQSDLPVSEIDNNNKGVAGQLMSGSEWRKVLKNLDSLYTSTVSSVTTSHFTWQYANVLNGTIHKATTNTFSYIDLNTTLATPKSDAIQKNVNGGFTRVYDYFKMKTAGGNFYWSGGSLGKIEFTGLYQNTADNSVYVPFRQQVELFVPAVPLIEVTSGVSSYDSSVFELNYTTNNGGSNTNGIKNAVPTFNSVQYPKKNVHSSLPTGYLGTAIFCESGGLISLNAFPVATSTAKGFFGVYDLSTYDFKTNTGTSLITPAKQTAFVDNGNGTMTLDPLTLNNHIGVNNGYNDILITYTYQDNSSPAVGVGYLVIRVTPNPVPGFNLSSTIAAVGATGASSFDALCVGSPITFDGGTASSILQASGPGNTAPNSNKIVNYTWDFGDVNSGAANHPLDTIRVSGKTSLAINGGAAGVRVPLYFNGAETGYVQALPPAFIANQGFGYLDSNPGTKYSVNLSYLSGSGAGSGATANIIVANHQVVSVELTNPGTGYLPTDILSVDTAAIPNTNYKQYQLPPDKATVPVAQRQQFSIVYGKFTMTFDKPWHYYASATQAATAKLDLISNWGCPSLSNPVTGTNGTNPPVTNTVGAYMNYPGSQADLYLGDTGIPDFSFVGNCAGTAVNFTYNAASTKPTQGVIAAYQWDFNKTNVNSQPGSDFGYDPANPNTKPNNVLFNAYIGQTAPLKNVAAFTYNSSGIYTAQLTTISNIGCKASTSKLLGQLTTKSASIIDFNSDNAGFLPLDISAKGASQSYLIDGQIDGSYVGKSSWQWSSASKNWSTTGGVVVDQFGARVPTGTYYQLENSALYAACLNMNIPRPMISFDASIDIQNSDGLILQYSKDNKNILDKTKRWYTIGIDSTQGGAQIPGIEWYNANAIASAPGNSVYSYNPLNIGWSGPATSNLIQQPKHALDNPSSNLASYSQPLQLRYVFASANNPPLAGVTIDNVRFGSRTRTILLENFTTTNGGADNTVNTQVASDASAISTFVQNNINSTQLVNVNYHVGFLGNDPFNLTNPADPSSRVLYYGVNEVPYAFLDGKHYNNTSPSAPVPANPELFQNWGQGQYDLQTLKLAQADFGLNTIKGTISANTSSNMVTGVGTLFTVELAVGVQIRNGLGTVIGTITGIASDTQLTLTSNAQINVSGGLCTTTGLTRLTGTITAGTASTVVVGTGSLFNKELTVGMVIYDGSNKIIGTVGSITDNLHLTLLSNAAVNLTGGVYQKINLVTPTTVTTDNSDGSISIDVNVTPRVSSLPSTTTLQVLVLEDTVMATELSPALITTGETRFEYVLRKMIPNAVGTKYQLYQFKDSVLVHLDPGGVVNGGTPFKWVMDKPLDQLHKDKFTVVLFLQDELTKEVYQAELYRNIPYPSSTVTGVEPPTAENLKVYPNPADQEMTIVLPSPAKETMSIRMANQLGEFTDFGSFAEGEQSKTIKTGSLIAGVYILQMGSSNNGIRTKVIVVH